MFDEKSDLIVNFTWNQTDPVPQKCVQARRPDEEEEDEYAEVVRVEYQVQLPKLDEKLEAETWPGVHVRFFFWKNIQIRTETFQKTSDGELGTENERRSVHKHSLTPAFRLHRTELEASADS